MTLALYMDHHIPKALTNALRLQGVDVLTAHEDGRDETRDSELLDRATELKRVLFTHDQDFFKETAKRQKEGIPFYGVIYAHPLRMSIGACVRDLEVIAQGGEPQDIVNRIQILPL